jgi:hypothetical protein
MSRYEEPFRQPKKTEKIFLIHAMLVHRQAAGGTYRKGSMMTGSSPRSRFATSAWRPAEGGDPAVDVAGCKKIAKRSQSHRPVSTV